MKLLKNTVLVLVFCLGASALRAQEANEVEKMKKQLQQLQETFEKVRREQQQQIETLSKKLEELSQGKRAVPAPKTAEERKLEQQLAAELIPPSVPPSHEMKKPWRPTDPIRLGSGQSYMGISFDGLFAAGSSTAPDIGALQTGGHDPKQRGFTVQNLETTFDGTVDPYFRGQANIILQVDPAGETIIEAEEAFLETLALPLNLQVKAGQYFTEFGRLNPTHPHSWDFVDQPLVNGRLLGPDGLRNPGARLSWLMPTPFYSELMLGLQNSQGGTAISFRSAGGHAHGGGAAEGLPLGYRHPDNDQGVRGLDDMLLAPRYVASFSPTEAQTLLLGASGLFGPNSSGQSGEVDTQIYGLDFTWKWKPLTQEKGFPFVKFQTELMLRKYRAGDFDWDEGGNGGDGDGDGFVDQGVLVDTATGLPAVLPAETLTDYGFYTQLSYGFKRGWLAGLRFDYVGGDRAGYETRSLLVADNLGGGTPVGRDPLRNSRWRISPNLTWLPTEFSKFRLQYNYDDRRDLGVDHSIWLQFEFLLGAHAAHKF